MVVRWSEGQILNSFLTAWQWWTKTLIPVTRLFTIPGAWALWTPSCTWTSSGRSWQSRRSSGQRHHRAPLRRSSTCARRWVFRTLSRCPNPFHWTISRASRWGHPSVFMTHTSSVAGIGTFLKAIQYSEKITTLWHHKGCPKSMISAQCCVNFLNFARLYPTFISCLIWSSEDPN